MMHMTFYLGKRVTILFDSWLTYFLSLLACFLTAVFYQYLEDRRLRFKLLPSSRKNPPSGTNAPLLLSKTGWDGWAPSRYAGAILFGINSAIGYLLMLVVQRPGFCGGGGGFGYLLFKGSDEDVL